MKASDQEKVFSGWQIVPLSIHLKSSITGGDCYNLEIIRALQELGGEVHGFVGRELPQPFNKPLLANIFWLSKVIDLTRPTVIFYDTSSFTYLVFTLLFIRIFTPAKTIAVTHHLAFSLSKNPIKRLVRRAWEKWMCRWADLLLTNSPSTRKMIQWMAGKAIQPVIVPPGMNIAYYKPRRHSFHNPPFKIIDVGYVSPHKGADVLIKAVSLLTDRDLELHFIGDYDHYHREYYDRCQVLVSNLNLQKRVFFHGFVSRKIMDRLMTEADLYVSPSYLEGYGISVMEAASFSLPLVLSDLPAFREIAGDSACYFPPGDFRRLAGVIDLLLKDPTKRMKLGKLAYARVDFSYDWDKMRASAKKEIMDWWWRLHGNKSTMETKIN